MRKIYLMLSALVIVMSSFAQVASTYTFSQSTTAYTPITGGTVYGNTSSDDEVFLDPAQPLGTTIDDIGPGIAIGFNFTYNGEVFDRVAIDYNGWISFGKSSLTPSVDHSSSSYYNSLSSTLAVTPAALRNRIAALSRDLEATPTSELRVQTLGAGTSQVLIIQWKDVKAYGGTNAGDLYNFQLRLQQTTNIISIAYGSFTRTATDAITAQVGLGGTTAADYNNRTTTTNWATSTAGTGNTSSMTLSSTILPATGLTFNWALASCLPPVLSSLQFTSTAIPNATISWGAVTAAASYEYAITASATPPVSGTNTTSTTASVSGLPVATVLYAHVRVNCGTSFSAWITKVYVPCTTNITPAANATNVVIPPSFSFNTVAGATAYRIFFSTDAGVTYPLAATVPASPVTINGLAYATTYRWFVRAIAGSDTAAVACSSNATSFTTQAVPPPPANDNCTGAIAINPYVAPVTGTTVSATQSFTPITCASFTSLKSYDVWYKVTATQSGTFSVSVTGNGSFDAVIGIYRGTCTALDSASCADATFNGGTEVATITNATIGTTYFIRVSDYYTSADSVGTFVISATGPALPVTGVNLSAIRNGSKSQLSWKTLTEINNAGFEIQRSADGKYFTGIASIASKATGGNSTAAISYNFDDVRPLAGANYYRLKQTDKDGKISYSNIVYLKGIAVNNLTVSAIYPNPTKDVLKASVQAPAAENITFVVTDMLGKTISRQTANVIIGDNMVNINVANLPSGSYLLKAICRNGCETAYQKFTKQ